MFQINETGNTSMKIDIMDDTGIVVRFPVERRQRPDICLLNDLSAVAELNGGVVDCTEDGWPTSREDAARQVGDLVANLRGSGMSEPEILAAARQHVEDLVRIGVRQAWAYQDAQHAAHEAQDILSRSPGLSNQATADLKTLQLQDAALASCTSALEASGAYDAVQNLASGRGARASTHEELEGCFIASLKALYAFKTVSA